MRQPEQASIVPTGQVAPKLPKHVGLFDGKPENYGRWLARFEPWAESVGLTDQQIKYYALSLLSDAAQHWADHRARAADFRSMSWEDFKTRMSLDLKLESEQMFEEILDEEQGNSQPLRQFCDRKVWAGQRLGRSDDSIKRAIVKRMNSELLNGVQSFNKVTVEELIRSLMEFEDVLRLNAKANRGVKRPRSPSTNKPGQSCTICKRLNHRAEDCWFKQKAATGSGAGDANRRNQFRRTFVDRPRLTGANAMHVASISTDAADPPQSSSTQQE